MKKEDFYNTKWDVREWTDEMKTRWQEKMFELGFSWAGLYGSGVRHLDKDYYYLYQGIGICYGDTILYLEDPYNNTEKYYEDVFPEELESIKKLETLAEDMKNMHESLCNCKPDIVKTALQSDVNVVAKPIKSDGGSSSYYDIYVPQWLLDKLLQRSECGNCFIKTEEINEILGNDFNYSTIFKSMVRAISLENGVGKQGNTHAYECNKVRYYIDRVEEKYKHKGDA